MMKFESIDAASSKELLDNGAALPVDIRQPNERAREHIRWGARLVSLPRWSVEDVEQDGDETAVDGGAEQIQRAASGVEGLSRSVRPEQRHRGPEYGRATNPIRT